MIAIQKQFFWENVAYRHLPDMDKTIAETKALTLDTMVQFAAILEDLGEADALRRLREEIVTLHEERRAKPPGKPDPRDVTEELFWEIIGPAATDEATADEQVTRITEQLACFKAPQIKVFHKLFWQAMDAANHHDLWAMAYLVQDGCSDDAFEGFRARLILQRRAAFDTALADPITFVQTVPLRTNNSAESMLQAPAIPYQWRSGKAQYRPSGRSVGSKGSRGRSGTSRRAIRRLFGIRRQTEPPRYRRHCWT